MTRKSRKTLIAENVEMRYILSQQRREYSIERDINDRLEAQNAKLYAKAETLHSPEYVTQQLEAIETATRKETLQTVIEALELKDYGYRDRKPGTLYIDLKSPEQHADALWGDLTDALALREEQKHAETRKKNAEKVAGLTKSVPLTMNGTVIGKVTLDDLGIPSSGGASISVPEGDLGSSYGSIKLDPEKVARRAEKAAAEAKKTAKQRAEEALTEKNSAKKKEGKK